ncbi:hypothetical protein AAHA92_25112 [Salvia divinorum]|uniref:Myb/SANT-like domain-containing protein n=1 Tax=Salvia divinorum TaxID=28513 RepID=A0ABD1G9K7_SALDI
MALIVPPHNTFFYKSNWKPEVDSLLLRTVIRKKHDSQCKEPMFPRIFFQEAATVIEKDTSYIFVWDELYERLLFLNHHYTSFKELVKVQATHWNVHAHTVSAADKVWKAILKKNKLAAAYYYRDEPEFFATIDFV